jgi:dihydrofolate reductase
MTVGAIWAQAANGVIGRDGTIPWSLPEDQRLFRRTTMGAAVVMGRRTWESLPDAVRPLPGRANIVVTGQPAWSAPGATAAGSLERALALAGRPVWVIGGAALYAEVLGVADVLVVTELADDVAGDTYAPALGPEWVGESPEGWQESASGLRYRVTTYRRGIV